MGNNSCCCKKKKKEIDNKLSMMSDFNVQICNDIFIDNSKNKTVKTSNNITKITNKQSRQSSAIKKSSLNERNSDSSNTNSISDNINNEIIVSQMPISEAKLVSFNSTNNKESEFIKDDYFTEEELIYYKSILLEEANNQKNKSQYFSFSNNLKKGEVIGEGGFSKVYKAFDESLGRLVAVKELKVSNLDTKKSKLVAVEREIDILSKLNHKNIVKYFGISYNDKNAISIILEYCAGGSLNKLISTYKKLTEKIIRKYLKQILEGLEYLHFHNIIHRDIKGANILVDKDGICKLSDFGGSKSVNSEQDAKKSNVFRGTPNWMAPESVKKLEYTRYSDIWAIGCLSIEMVTGEPPWNHFKNPMAVLFQLYNNSNPPPIPTNISPLFKDFIDCCLQIEPKKRLNVTALIKHQFISGNKKVDELRINIASDKRHSTNPNSVGSLNSSSSNSSKLENKFFNERIDINKFSSKGSD